MKTLFSLLFAYSFVIYTFAQITLDQSIAPEIGETWDVTFLEVTSFSEGPAGANQTWDFGSINTTGAFGLEFRILDPTTTPGYTNFPTSDFVWSIPEFGTFQFYQTTPDSIVLLGGVSTTQSGEINFLTINTDPEDSFRLPLTFGDNHTFFTKIEQYFFGNLLALEERNGTLEVDGYGTIITPIGTYTDVLRIKIVEESFGMISTQFAWLNKDSFIPIMVFESSTDPEQPASLYYSTPNDTDPTTSTSALSQLTAFRIHATNNGFPLQIQFTTPNAIDYLDCQLFTTDGKLIHSQQFTNIPQGQNSLEITSSSLSIPCGITILQITTDQGQRSEKVWLCTSP